MKKKVLIALLVVLALAASASVVWAEGGSANGSDIWVYQDGNPATLVKSIYYRNSSGIIHQWRCYPVDLHLIFKPADSFSRPDEGNYFYWRYDHSRYTEIDANPGELLDYYVDGAYYWVEINPQ
jgi:hypothetical protein